jgi:hypothetical protein
MREDDDGQFRSVRDPLRRARPAPPRMLNWMNAADVLLRLCDARSRTIARQSPDD